MIRHEFSARPQVGFLLGAQEEDRSFGEVRSNSEQLLRSEILPIMTTKASSFLVLVYVSHRDRIQFYKLWWTFPKRFRPPHCSELTPNFFKTSIHCLDSCKKPTVEQAQYLY